jgi:formate dehydrogenase subunit beta
MATTVRLEVPGKSPLQAVQGFLRTLFEAKEIRAVLAPMHLPGGVIMPSLIADPDKLDRIDPFTPSFPLNGARMAARVTRGDGDGKIAAVLRPCEVRAFIELVKLNQGASESVIVISPDCLGAMTNIDYRHYAAGKDPAEATLGFLRAAFAGKTEFDGVPMARACMACEHPAAVAADISIGIPGADLDKEIYAVSNTPKGEGLLTRLKLEDCGKGQVRQDALAKLVGARTAFRDDLFAKTEAATDSLEKLGAYLAGCVNCYNCRVACPVCYCKECVFVTDVFDHKPWQYMGWAKSRGTLRLPTDTIFYHLTRLAHMSLSCVGCGQCSNACPNDVPVMELFRSVAVRTQKSFDYEPGRNQDEPLPLSVFHEKEYEDVVGIHE